MHNIKRYQTTQRQTHQGCICSTHSTQCAKRGTRSLFKRSSCNSPGFSQPSLFSSCLTTQGFTNLALLSSYSAICLCCQFYSTFHCLSVIWIAKLQCFFALYRDGFFNVKILAKYIVGVCWKTHLYTKYKSTIIDGPKVLFKNSNPCKSCLVTIASF